MYFFYSEDIFLLNNQIKKTIKELQQKDQYDVLSFSLIEDDFNTIYDNVTNLNFFSSKSIIVISDAYFVTEIKTNFNKNYSLNKLEIMLKNFNPNNVIIFTLNSNKFSKKLKIAKYIESNFNVKYLSLWDEKQTIKYIIDYLKSKNKIIDINLANQIYNLLPNDLQIITNEINKLANLKSELNIDIIKTNLNKYHNEDIFKLVDAFINNNIDKFIKLYHDYILLNDDIIGLISLLDTNLSFYRDVVILKKQFKSEEQISTILKSHIYRVKLAVKNSYDINTLNDKIKIVYKIYKGIINWNINKKTLVEYMLIKNMKG
ncbi:DNA polymerase III subunit delta [Mycoplasma capricolum subsp. capricolum]|uniref:DNA polymerase III subunit delta n=1 Tax=Mycoplasma capricolum TaxID=2095 RepID=UPI0020BE6923|nr:DNA polymerase III subunit delta [Mycoplasma capricolum]MCK8461872.1 DNA polymerase III subunit delta [Mycoplasma capricolum subsp. capricolum]